MRYRVSFIWDKLLLCSVLGREATGRRDFVNNILRVPQLYCSCPGQGRAARGGISHARHQHNRPVSRADRSRWRGRGCHTWGRAEQHVFWQHWSRVGLKYHDCDFPPQISLSWKGWFGYPDVPSQPWKVKEMEVEILHHGYSYQLGCTFDLK